MAFPGSLPSRAKKAAPRAPILKLHLVRRVRGRHGFGGVCWGGTYALHDHMLDMDGCDRPVAAVALDPRDGLYDIQGAALSPDRITTIESRLQRLGNKELAAVRVRPGVGHCQASRRIELERRHDFVLVRKARASRMSRAVAERIAALNHEVGDHAVKYEAVKKILACGLIRLRVHIGELSDGQAHHGVDGDRRFRFVELARNVSFVRLKCHVQSGFSLIGLSRSRRGRMEGMRCLEKPRDWDYREERS